MKHIFFMMTTFELSARQRRKLKSRTRNEIGEYILEMFNNVS